MKKSKLFLLSTLALLTPLASCDFGNESSIAQQAIDDAADYLKTLYIENPQATTANYQVTTSFELEGVSYPVEWRIEVEEGGLEGAVSLGEVADGLQTINVVYSEAFSTKKTEYKLIAKIQNGELSSEISFKHNVPQFKFTTYAEFKAAADNSSKDELTVKGNIVAIYKNGFYMQDGSGDCYYAYSPNGTDWKSYKIGDEVQVTGTATKYNNQYEFNSGCVASPKTAVAAEFKVQYQDISTVFSAQTSIVNNPELLAYVNKPVEIKGIKVDSRDDSNSYYYFTSGELKSYFRPSTSWINNTTGANVTQDEIDAMVEEWVPGFTANVKGIAQVYNGTFYLAPIETSPIEYTDKTLTDAGKAAADATTIIGKLADHFNASTSIALPATGGTYESTFTYTTEGDGIKVENGNLVIQPQATVTNNKLKVKGNNNGAEFEKTFKIEVNKAYTEADLLTPAQAAVEAAKLDAATKETSEDWYFVKGTIDEIYNTGYCNAYMNYVEGEATKKLTVYGLYSAADGGKTVYGLNKSGIVPVGEGYEVVLATKFQNYNGTLELVSAQLVSVVTPKTYTVTLPETVANATITASKVADIAGGEKVTLNVTVEDDYTATLKVNDAEVKITEGQAEIVVIKNSVVELTTELNYNGYIVKGAALTMLDEGNSSTYGKYAGVQKINGLDVTIADVLPTTYNTYSALQMKKQTGTITFTGKFDKVIFGFYTKEADIATAGIKLFIDDVEYTVSANEAVLTQTGKKVTISKVDYDLNYIVITVEADETTEHTYKIQNTSGFANYLSEVRLPNPEA